MSRSFKLWTWHFHFIQIWKSESRKLEVGKPETGNWKMSYNNWKLNILKFENWDFQVRESPLGHAYWPKVLPRCMHTSSTMREPGKPQRGMKKWCGAVDAVNLHRHTGSALEQTTKTPVDPSLLIWPNFFSKRTPHLSNIIDIHTKIWQTNERKSEHAIVESKERRYRKNWSNAALLHVCKTECLILDEKKPNA